MSFQDNKFPILLGAVTVVVTGGLVFWSVKSGGKYDAAKSDYDSASGTIDRLMRTDIEPTEDNLLGKKQAVEAYAESIGELQKAFDSRRRPTLENIEPSAYTDELLAARKRVLAEFEKAGTELPEAFFLGHGRFSDTLPQRKNTGVLSFQLGAFEDLLTRLAQSGVSALNNLYWAGIPEPKEGSAVIAHPLELTFTGTEDSMRRFLSALDDTKDHYYVVRSMRVKNERDSAPNANDARFERVTTTPPAGNPADPFGSGGFVFPEEDETPAPAEDGEAPAPGEGEGDLGEAPAPAAPEPEPVAPAPAEPTDSGEILKQVLGTEKIQVFVRIDVLQFLEPINP